MRDYKNERRYLTFFALEWHALVRQAYRKVWGNFAPRSHLPLAVPSPASPTHRSPGSLLAYSVPDQGVRLRAIKPWTSTRVQVMNRGCQRLGTVICEGWGKCAR